MNRHRCSVVDDWVMAPMSDRSGETSGRCRGSLQTRSMILTSQVRVRWHEQIKDPNWPTESSTAGAQRASLEMRGDSMRKRKERRRKVNESAGEKLWKDGTNRPWKSRSVSLFAQLQQHKLTIVITFYKSKNSVASLRRLITPTRNADHDQPGTLIIFHGIRIEGRVAMSLVTAPLVHMRGWALLVNYCCLISARSPENANLHPRWGIAVPI